MEQRMNGQESVAWRRVLTKLLRPGVSMSSHVEELHQSTQVGAAEDGDIGLTLWPWAQRGWAEHSCSGLRCRCYPM